MVTILVFSISAVQSNSSATIRQRNREYLVVQVCLLDLNLEENDIFTSIPSTLRIQMKSATI